MLKVQLSLINSVCLMYASLFAMCTMLNYQELLCLPMAMPCSVDGLQCGELKTRWESVEDCKNFGH